MSMPILDNGQGVIDPDTYFISHHLPTNIIEDERKIREFVDLHQASKRRIVLVTSGGTTVPLENQTVRFIDNFSAGTRGAISAEYFLQIGYAVIFMHRHHSLQPYSRLFSHSTNCLLDYLYLREDGHVGVESKYEPSLTSVLKKYQDAQRSNTLLFVEFTTITDYLFLLKLATGVMSSLEGNAMYYLAAAVSDFFIPAEKMAEHKIQSRDGPLTLLLDQVPKFLKPLVSQWAPKGFIVSFKLETDPHLLSSKSRTALERYGHQVVIGNILTTRKQMVTLTTTHDAVEIKMTPEELKGGVEIESKIVSELKRRHDIWVEEIQNGDKEK